ncbi:DUF3108 domain-containing protein [Desulfobulbus rhabdoformis]|uniref:DUF3108 domain-containing protein n=1 Tax=Desulfobulbus rhabdoformis TaxID=34032 RepID=UPI001965B23C|nr:DUF3108 domain-containing protein [Desulfobulbus rhabdoformis]MBM9613577.1 DUF3108 domain-containing protein [Desulfobulbus rhabdoformis]
MKHMFIAVVASTLLLAPTTGICKKLRPEVELRPSQIRSETVDIIYSGKETLHYSVSWSGGVKIGDIYLKIRPTSEYEADFVIDAKVKDYGPLSLFYPVDDRFRCFVSGVSKLPVRYEVKQNEGYDHKTTRLSLYDQTAHTVRYQKNKNKVQEYTLDGGVYNEFTSFIISRALKYIGQVPIIVPTFADKKRHAVQVAVVKKERRKTIFGKRPTLKIEPRMQFRGLYEKSGGTTLWLTDDRCRVPVEIHSRIVIGSLVAELVDYTNPACPELQRKQR